MRLTVQLFADLRERAGSETLVVEDLPDGLDLAGLKETLESRYPELGPLGHVAGVIGTEYVPDATELEPGVRVALLPPVSGGAPTEDELLSAGVFELCAEPLDPESLRRRVAHPSCGAVVVFCGDVRDRNLGREVERLEYEAFERMAGPQMERIFAACREHGGASDPAADDGASERALRMVCVHRTGPVEIGETSVVVAVASPHRDAAFVAARFLIDELKRSLPVWKKEFTADGGAWIGEGA
ncbi:MAG: molybdenum cofactor biosynthesis protein MoaE [Planctomycetota bacterium]|jgi:molybdopterin synthase catalytic subunit|nr:molybdenum cofactor biosynthesis protein MoaE [Planctomycetota bacterium]MDP6762539.1 molybdenum cofactor biosynthesis protein MoaE [Planctomycetota bacterium]MDP6988098.1 molybdenum cofactor biosynthesis protein MoaE [Planctomycetota bacterium]